MDTSYRLSRSNDRAMICAVVHRYAHTGRDKMDFGDMVPLFTANAIVVLPGGTQVAPTRLSDVVRGKEANYIRHHVTTVDIRFLGPNEAAVDSFFFAVTDQAAPDHWGFWRDTFNRQADGSWLISRREINVDGGPPHGWFGRTYGAN
jgi:hypothetical protein